MSYQFYVLTRTLFGTGKLNELHAQEMPVRQWEACLQQTLASYLIRIVWRFIRSLLDERKRFFYE